MENAYDTDGFNTVTIRPDPAFPGSLSEGPAAFHFMDSVTLVVCGVSVADPSQLLFAAEDASGNEVARLLAGTSWAAVPGRAGSVYASVAFDLQAAKDLSDAGTPGRPSPIRLYLRDPSGRTVLDASADFFPCPFPVGGTQNPAGTAVLKAALAAAVSAVRAMPSLNAAMREEIGRAHV